MTDPITVLALAAGTSLVSAVATDAWSTVRSRLVRLLGKGNPAREAQEVARLDATAASIAHDPSEKTRASHAALWQESFADVLRRDPAMADQLREILGIPAPGGGSVTGRNVNTGTVHGILLQTDQISGTVNFGHDPRGQQK